MYAEVKLNMYQTNESSGKADKLSGRLCSGFACCSSANQGSTSLSNLSGRVGGTKDASLVG